MLNNATQSLSQNRTIQNLGVLLAIAASVALFVFVINYLGVIQFGARPEINTVGGTSVEVEGFQFVQEALHVKAGTEVKLNLSNDDILPHSFDVDELDIHIGMPGNGTVSATFTALEPGRYTFYCAEPGHRAAGMVGTLVVEP
ncbi:MAG: cupredoxin domain-containing protein [Candidatus Promineifilaceae bacterium]